MDVLKKGAKPPTLRTIEDLKGKSLGLEDVVDLSALYGMTIDNSNDEHIARMGVFHPSSVGYCKKREVMQYIGIMPTDRKTKKLQQIFKTGHLYHDLIQGGLEKLAEVMPKHHIRYEFTKEVPCDKKTDQLFLDFGIAGTTDGIIRFWTDYWEQRGILEAKSQNDDRHKTLQSMKQAYPSHLQQAHLYAYRFDCPVIWAWYVNKNDSSREVRPSFFDWAIFDSALMYFSECMDYVVRGQLPPREESWFECSECVYRTACEPKCLAGSRGKTSLIPTANTLRKAGK
jgi:hypothetical protein